MRANAANVVRLARALGQLRRRRPTVLSFNVTNRCNERCAMCAVWRTPARELALPEMRRVLADLRREGIRIVEVSGGEPFLRDDIFHIFALLDDLGLLYTVTTNATVLPADIVRRLDGLGGLLQLAVSLDSLDRDRYARLRGADRLPQALGALEALAGARRRFPVKLNFAMSRINVDETLAVLELAKRRGIFLSVFPANRGRGLAHRSDDPTLVATAAERAEMAAVFRTLSRLRRRGEPLWDYSRFYDLAADHVLGRAVGSCDAGKLYLDLHADGALAVCVDQPGFADLLAEPAAAACGRLAAQEASIRACAQGSPCCYTCTTNLSVTADHLVDFALETLRVRATAAWRRGRDPGR